MPFKAKDVLERSTLPTVNGAQATISIDSDGVPRIDEAMITSTDIGARNDDIHIIDRVIFPK